MKKDQSTTPPRTPPPKIVAPDTTVPGAVHHGPAHPAPLGAGTRQAGAASADCPGCAEPDLAFARHDHAHCATDALSRADAMVRQRGMRMTPVRRRTLEILLEAHRALGAYDVLARLGAEGFGTQPPVAYRALEFLTEHGLAHRVSRLNAFVACMHPGEAHAPAFLICRACHLVAEAPAQAVGVALAHAAASVGFRIERSTVEVQGLCPACAGDPA